MTYKKDRKNLRRRFNKYNFRKSWRDENGNLKSFSVTLDTTSLTVARKRAGEILGRWDEVKAGTGFEWSWQGEYNRTTVMERRLDDAIQKYIKHKQADGLKQSSIKRIRNSLDNLINSSKPAIFWKEKPLVKKQLSIWSLGDLKKIIDQINNTELLCKKHPKISKIIFFDFFSKICKKASNFS